MKHPTLDDKFSNLELRDLMSFRFIVQGFLGNKKYNIFLLKAVCQTSKRIRFVKCHKKGNFALPPRLCFLENLVVVSGERNEHFQQHILTNVLKIHNEVRIHFAYYTYVSIIKKNIL